MKRENSGLYPGNNFYCNSYCTLNCAPTVGPVTRHSRPHYVIKLTVAYAKYRHGYGPTLVQVIACCLAATSHYLNQCRLIVIGVLWHSPKTVMLNTIYLSIGIVCQPLQPLFPHTVIFVSCNIIVIAQYFYQIWDLISFTYWFANFTPNIFITSFLISSLACCTLVIRFLR